MQSEEEDIRQQNHDEEEREGANGEEEDAVSGYEPLDPNRLGTNNHLSQNVLDTREPMLYVDVNLGNSGS